MSQDDLFLQTDGLRSFAQSHTDVVSGLTGLLNSAPGASGVQITHGAIASAVHTALSSALGARRGSMQNVVNVGRNLAESLQAAAHSYEQVDQRSGQKAQAAAETFGETSVAGKAATELTTLVSDRSPKTGETPT